MTSPTESECPENTIGKFCVPCNWIYENCEQIKICDNDKCVCSSGYNIANKNCYNSKITHVYINFRVVQHRNF
jgi:hypothetical protein